MSLTSDSIAITSKKSSAPRVSAGILLYRFAPGGLEVFLGHPGGPFFARKDLGSWTIPKGGLSPDESPEAGARREFQEEVGFVPEQTLVDLGELKQRSGKTVRCFAAAVSYEDRWVEANFRSMMFSLEWPPKSGKTAEFPELDQAVFYPLEIARQKILPGQAEFLNRLLSIVEQP